MHLDVVNVQEERFAAFGMGLDMGDRIVGLPFVKSRERIVGDGSNFRRGLPATPSHSPQVHNRVVHLFEIRVVRREPGMKPLRSVVVGIDACIISGKLLHLVEAMLDRVRHRLVDQVPLAREVRGVPILFEKFGNGWSA
jgi:hypothetical protein